MPFPRWFVDTADLSLTGLSLGVNSGQSAGGLLLVRGDLLPREIQLLVNTGGKQRQQLDVTGGSLIVTIGETNDEPTSGSFALSYNADATGLTGLSYSIMAAALQTALNANPTLATGPASVVVTKTGNAYTVVWDQVGVRSLLASASVALVPLVGIEIERLQTGAAAVREIQVITLQRTPYAQQSTWTVAGAGTAGAVTVVTAGTTAQNAVYDVSLVTTATGGSFELTVGRPQIYNFNTPANTAIKANGTITCVAGTSLANKFFDLPGAASAIVRFWYDQGAGTPPATPTGGSLQSITTTTAGDSAITVAALTATVIEAHAAFTSSVTSGALISWASATFGIKTTVASAGDSGHTMTTTSQGNNGQLDQKSFNLYDADGTVAVWFDASSAGATGYPAAAAAARRQIRVVIAADDSATAVAGLAKIQVDGDANFVATNAIGNLVIVTLVTAGELPDPDSAGMVGATGFLATTVLDGSQTTAVLPWGATVADFAVQFGAELIAVQRADNKWRLTTTAKGAYTTPVLGETGLINPTYFTGSMSLDDSQLKLSLAQTTDDSIDAWLEIQFTDAASKVSTPLRMLVTLVRDL